MLRSFLHNWVVEVDPTDHPVVGTGLGRGELEAMALYKKLQADLMLVDDEKARHLARHNGINVVGSLGVLVQAKQIGIIGSIRPMLHELRQSGIYVREDLLREALRLAGEELHVK